MINNPKTVSREKWLAARKVLLAQKKQVTRDRDALAAERRKLPWVKVEKSYLFDELNGKVTLADLFDGKPADYLPLDVRSGVERSLPQLLIQHGSYGWRAGAPGATRRFVRGDFTSTTAQDRRVQTHGLALEPRVFERQRFQPRLPLGVHQGGTREGEGEHNFNLEAFPGTDAPGISVFFEGQNGDNFHTDSAYARGTETTMNTYNRLDYVPKGHDEGGLAFTMSWLRHHGRYTDGQLAGADMPYWAADASSTR